MHLQPKQLISTCGLDSPSVDAGAKNVIKNRFIGMILVIGLPVRL